MTSSPTSSPVIDIAPFSADQTLQVRDLIVPIQREEFKVEITYEDQPDLQNIPTHYQKGNGQFWTAVSDSKVIGTIALEDIGENMVALRKVFVHADFRGPSRIAHRLLDTAIAFAKERGLDWIYLGSTAQMTGAHRFYEKRGFERLEKSDLPENFYHPKVDTVFYRLEL